MSSQNIKTGAFDGVEVVKSQAKRRSTQKRNSIISETVLKNNKSLINVDSRVN